MIELIHLTKKFGDLIAVNDVTLTIPRGEFFAMLGPNAAGKTTTLRCLAGIIPAARGTIRLVGHDLRVAAVAAKQELAYFPDEPRLFDYLTVRQHLNFTARLYHVRGYERLAEQLLAELELADKADNLPTELSRGMKQKLAIACGLLHSPKVIFFDEPLTGLDPYGIRGMKDAILRRAKEGIAIIISSHLLHLVDEICSHLLILKQGRKVADGTLEDVRRQFAESAPDTSLEEVFFRATAEAKPAVGEVKA